MNKLEQTCKVCQSFNILYQNKAKGRLQRLNEPGRLTVPTSKAHLTSIKLAYRARASQMKCKVGKLKSKISAFSISIDNDLSNNI